MKHLGSLPRRMARRAVHLIAPAVIALTVAGGAAAVASGPAGAATRVTPAPITWHPFKLINGWQSASQSNRVTGTPSWALSHGVVYLRGEIKQPTPGGDEIAVLPPSVRPASDVYLLVFTRDYAPGILLINTDGTVLVGEGVVSANPPALTSLNGVSYLAAPMKRTKLSLEHGWVSSQSQWKSGDPSITISRGVVYLSGSMHTNGTSRVAALLPKAARPAQIMLIEAYTFDGATGYLKILPTGQLEAFGAAATEFTTLDVSYPVAGTKWHALALSDNWKSAAAKAHTAAPSYTIVNGVVFLNGSMYQAPKSNGFWSLKLPAGVRTKADVLDLFTMASGGNPGAITITDTGGIAGSLPYSNAMAFTSLAGLAYPSNS